jgi:hypothetical protein
MLEGVAAQGRFKTSTSKRRQLLDEGPGLHLERWSVKAEAEVDAETRRPTERERGATTTILAPIEKKCTIHTPPHTHTHNIITTTCM